jgi:hypothetical protein
MSRKPKTPGAVIPGPEGRTPHNREWEANQRKVWKPLTFRKVPEEITDQVNEIAGELYVIRDEVFRKLWEYAYEAYQRGEIELEPVLKSGRLTLFPEERD